MPNIELDANLLSLLPPWYREVLDYQEICRAEEEQFAALAEDTKSVTNNFFFQTMDESAVAQWEQVLSITPYPATEDLEFRRVRLLNRLSTRPPFTIGLLYQKLDELGGIDKWEATVENFTIDLLIDYDVMRDEPKRLTELMNLLFRILPAHIAVNLSGRIIGTAHTYHALHGGVLMIMYGEVIL